VRSVRGQWRACSVSKKRSVGTVVRGIINVHNNSARQNCTQKCKVVTKGFFFRGSGTRSVVAYLMAHASEKLPIRDVVQALANVSECLNVIVQRQNA
jgi:hypothetical protein